MNKRQLIGIVLACTAFSAGKVMWDDDSSARKAEADELVASAPPGTQSRPTSIIDALDPNLAKSQADHVDASPAYRPPPTKWERVKCFFGDKKPCDRTPVWPQPQFKMPPIEPDLEKVNINPLPFGYAPIKQQPSPVVEVIPTASETQ